MVPIKRVSLGSIPHQPVYPQAVSAYPEPPTSLQQGNLSLESGWKLGVLPSGGVSARPGIATGIPVTQLMHSGSEASFASHGRSSYGPLQEKYAIN